MWKRRKKFKVKRAHKQKPTNLGRQNLGGGKYPISSKASESRYEKRGRLSAGQKKADGDKRKREGPRVKEGAGSGRRKFGENEKFLAKIQMPSWSRKVRGRKGSREEGNYKKEAGKGTKAHRKILKEPGISS